MPTRHLYHHQLQMSETKEAQLQEFYAEHQAFCVTNCATIAMNHAEDLIMHSKPLRLLVNGHLELQRARLSKQNATALAAATDKDTYEPKTAFADALIVFAAQTATGRWTAPRKLMLSIGQDAALVDKRTYSLAAQMAANGVFGGILVLEALEQTSLRIVARASFLFHVRYLASANIHTIVDYKERVDAMSNVTDFQLYGTSCAIEDINRHFAIVRAAEQAGRNAVDLSFEPTVDDANVARVKRDKFTSDASLNECLSCLLYSAHAYQAFEIREHQQRLLNYVLVQYPGILEQVERSILNGVKAPTVVSIRTRAAQLEDAITGTTWCTMADIHKTLEQKEKSGEPLTRTKKLIEASLAIKKDYGGDAVIFEIIDVGRGLAYGHEMHHVTYIGDIVGLKDQVLLGRKQKAEQDRRTKYEKTMDAPTKNEFPGADEESAKLIVEKRAQSVEEVRREWDEARAKIDAEFAVTLAKAMERDGAAKK